MTSWICSLTFCLALAGTPDAPRLEPIPEVTPVSSPLTVLAIGITPCQNCGVSSCKHKLCRVIPITEEIKKTVWVVQVKDYCVPKPQMCGKCGSCVAAGSPTIGTAPRPDQLPPKCGPVRTRQELVKKEVALRRPIWKCAVICCGHCPGDCHFANLERRSVPDAPSDPVNPDTPKATTTMRNPAARGDESEPTIRMPRFE